MHFDYNAWPTAHIYYTFTHRPQQIARPAENVVLQIELSFHFEVIWYSFMHSIVYICVL